MAGLIAYAISHARLTISLLVFLLLAGLSAYVSIPKEAEPDVRIPIIYVSLSQRGISPEDSERLLLRPMETRLKSILNVKEMRAAAFEGGGYVLLEFEAGFNSDKALQDVRAKVEDSKRDLPRDADEPKVNEVNLSLFPVLVVGLGGDLPERTLVRLARLAKNAIEQTPGVLSADLKGARDEVVEVIAEPMQLKSYGVSLDDLIRTVQASNQLIAAGALEGGSGRFAVKVPGLIEDPRDMLKIPVVASSGASVTLGDVAEVRPTFKDAITITRINGKRAITIEVVKRTGANIVETVDAVKRTLEKTRALMPSTLEITFTQDKSRAIRQMLGDLQNSVITGILLVTVVMLATLGPRASFFIGIAIPGSFLVGMLALSMWGLTVNIVVLFTLILALGDLVDNSIVVTEYAERRMAEGMPAHQAYQEAATRMTAPVLSGTLARLVTFTPLLFWPGIVGEFMKYLPITFMVTLAASIAIALFFTPTLGALFGRPPNLSNERVSDRSTYMRVVDVALRFPGTTLLATLALLVGIQVAYARYGRGVEFFPKVEPDFGLVQVRARGNLALTEKDRVVRQVEAVLMAMPDLATVYARAGESQKGSAEITEDTIGTLQYEFVDWRKRRGANAIMEEIRQRTAGIPGVIIEVTGPKAGPPTGKPITLRLGAVDPEMLLPAARRAGELLRDLRIRDVLKQPKTEAEKKLLAEHGETVLLRDFDDGLPLPGIDWSVRVDRAEAAKFLASSGMVGNAIQLVTNGLKVTEYRPADTDKAVDIIVRYPDDRRNLTELDEMRVNTQMGSVPMGNFVSRQPTRRVSIINRAQGSRVVTLTANVAEGIPTALAQAIVTQVMTEAQAAAPGLSFQLKGEDEERAKAQAFLGKAFATAIFLMFAVLLGQFNKFSSVALIMSAVVFSTIGVFVGLIVMGQPLGVVMTGLGIISIAGVIVNNNIILIDTYDELRQRGMEAHAAVRETCAQRARPVFLTAITNILGIAPIAFGVNVDFLEREVTIGAPATQWWIQLSTATLFGLSFATVLTLIVTPAALLFVARMANGRRRLVAWWRRGKRREFIAPMAATPASISAGILPLTPPAR